MTNRLSLTLQGKPADCVPAAPLYLSLYLADRTRIFYIEQYEQRLRGREFHQVDHREDTGFRVNAIRQAYAVFNEQPDWMEIDRGASYAWAQRTAIVRHSDRLYYQDQETGLQVAMDQVEIPVGNPRLEPARPPTSQVDRWDLSTQFYNEASIAEFLPIIPSEHLLQSGEFDFPRQLVAECGHETFVQTVVDTPYSDSYEWLGFQGLMLAQLERPEFFHHFLRQKLTQSKEVIRAWADTGIEGIFVEEVLSGADMISPGSFEEYVLPYNREFFDFIKGCGLTTIHYICGDVIPRLGQIRTYDIAALAVEESKKKFTIEIEDVVQEVGDKMVVFGNIDTVKYGLNSTLEELASEVCRQIKIGSQANGFVVSTGSPFPLETDPRWIDCLVSKAHQSNYS